MTDCVTSPKMCSREKLFIIHSEVLIESAYEMKHNYCLPECTSQKKPNDTHSVFTMETLLSSLFLSKTKYAHFQPFKVEKRVLFGTDMVPILS